MSASRKKKERKLLEEAKLVNSPAKKNKEKKTGVDRALRDVLIVVGIILLAAIIIISCVSCKNYNKKHAVIATIGDHKVTAPMMNYAFMDTVNMFYSSNATYINYGLFGLDVNKPLDEQQYMGTDESQTWADYFIEQAAHSLEEYYNIGDYAEQSGYKLTSDQESSIKAELSNVETYAKSVNRSADSYLASIYGAGCNLKNYEEYITMRTIASGCYSDYYSSIEVTDEEAAAKYDEDPTAFDSVSYYMISKKASEFAEATDATATPEIGDAEKAQAKAAAEEVKANFDTTEISPATNSKETISNNYSEEAATWLYDSARKDGDIEMFANEDETAYYVFRFIEKDNHDYNTVNCKSIAIAVDSTAEDSDAAIEEAFAKYSEIKEKITAENFEQIAEEYGLAVTPGQNVTKGDVDDTVSPWLFSTGRKENDLKDFNVGTAYYFYLYESTGDNYKTMLVKDKITNDLLEQWEEEHAHTNEPKLNKDKFDYLNTDLIISKVFSVG